MGYKLAGFDVVGFNEIDSKLAEVYIENHHPKYSFIESIVDFKNREDLPEELFNLDILDGSPPCSSFSIAGLRKKTWGVEKKFREGQSSQILDTLFFDFIDLAKRLQPKVVVAENVKGMLIGDAIKYVVKIHKEFDVAGYYCQHFLLDASRMGVPQKRERVFFICLRKDLASRFIRKIGFHIEQPYIDMRFNDSIIPFKMVSDENDKECILTEKYIKYWVDAKQNSSVGKFYACYKLAMNLPASTSVSTNENYHPLYKRKINKKEAIAIQTFPSDYNFGKQSYGYLLGMSVPPIMTAQIATRIYDYWLSKLK